MIGALAGLVGGINTKVLIYAGIAATVALAIFGVYRAGGKAATARNVRKTLERTFENMGARENVEAEIRDRRRAGISSVSRVRDRWSRD